MPLEVGVMDHGGTQMEIEEIERLILTLYSPNSPELVLHTQSVLHRIQRSPEGWKVAQDLLARSDEKVRFFGALTLIVKLNTESSGVSEDNARELLSRLLLWFADASSPGSSPIVGRKLSSALVVYFLEFSSLWPRCICGLLSYLQSGQNLQDVDATVILASAQAHTVGATLRFLADLLEEAGKLPIKSAKHADVFATIKKNLPDATVVVSYGLQAGYVADDLEIIKLRESSIKTLLSLIVYSHIQLPRNDPLLDSLRSLIPIVLPVALSRDVIHSAAMELLIEVLSNLPGFLPLDYSSMLFTLVESPLGLEYHQRLLSGDLSFEYHQYGLFAIALGDFVTRQLITMPSGREQILTQRLLELLNISGYPAVEDRLFVPLVEFWSTYTETILDLLEPGLDNPPWLQTTKALAMKAVLSSCRRIIFPPLNEFNEWDSAEREGFVDARRDVADLLQSMLTISGPDLVKTFVNLVLTTLSTSAWNELEATSFCLGALADSISGDAEYDDILSLLVSSRFFDIMDRKNGDVPPRTRQTCISLIDKFSDYFERNLASIPRLLNLLFAVLDDPLLSAPASKSIQRLCSSCRLQLVSEAGVFLKQYDLVASKTLIDCPSRERIIGGIASVIQAIPHLDEQSNAARQLLEFVVNDAELAIALRNGTVVHGERSPCSTRCLHDSHENDISLHTGLRALSCLASIGRGFQTPVDGPIILDQISYHRNNNVDGREISIVQSQIITVLVNLRGGFPESGDIVEGICNVLRTGFSESEPGPFVFPPELTADFLIQYPRTSPRIGAIVSTASSFLSSLRDFIGESIGSIIMQVFVWVLGILSSLPSVDFDPELAQNGIEFAGKVVSRDIVFFLGSTPQPLLDFFFEFTLQVLESREPLPKAAAADFWGTFLSAEESGALDQGQMKLLTDRLGPILAQTLVRNIGGNASRSELDKLSDLLKKLVSWQPLAKVWLGDALVHPSFPSQRVSLQEKQTFLKKIISLRGARTTNQVVREFWLAARGSNFAYTS